MTHFELAEMDSRKSLQKQKRKEERETSGLQVTYFDMPFLSMVTFTLKLAVASFPAMFLIGVMYLLFFEALQILRMAV